MIISFCNDLLINRRSKVSNSFKFVDVLMDCRPIARHETEKKQSALRYVRIETAIALVCSFLINLFIVSVFARVSIEFTLLVWLWLWLLLVTLADCKNVCTPEASVCEAQSLHALDV